MAGPTASVLVSRVLSAADLDRVAAYISTKASCIKGRDFWIEDRPFFWDTGEEYEGELAEIEMPASVGWEPADQICFAAMCNDRSDHVTLAQLCVEVGQMFQGIIDFGGPIAASSQLEADELWEWSYESVSGKAKSHLGSPEFLRWWMHQPNFRMVK